MTSLTICQSFPNLRKSSPSKNVKVKTKASPAQFTETLGGRLAMQGLTWGTATRFMLNEHFADQLSDPHNIMTTTAVTGLVALASAVTVDKFGEESYFSWTPKAETFNGRMAMLGIVAALAFNI